MPVNSVNSGAVWVVLADIHANLEALQAVLSDATQQAGAIGVPEAQLRYLSLGDVVDYGPNPVECLNWVEWHCDIKLRGNHDWEASRCPNAIPRVWHVARDKWPVTIWTRCQLHDDPGQRRTLHDWPARIAYHPDLSGFMLGHEDLRPYDAQRRYSELVSKTQIKESLFAPLRDAGTQYGLIGHSHKPAIYYSVFNVGIEATPDEAEADGQWPTLPKGKFVVLNPGGVGQPKKFDWRSPSDPRAQYLLLDTREPDIRYRFRRVDYPKEKTVEKLARIVLPEAIPDSCELWSDDLRSPLRPEHIKQIRADLARQLRDLGEQLLHGHV